MLTGLPILIGLIAVAYPIYRIIGYIIRRRQVELAHIEALELNAVMRFFVDVNWEEVGRQLRAVAPTMREATEAMYLLTKAAREC